MNDLDTFAAYAMSALIGYGYTGIDDYDAGAEKAYRWAGAMARQQNDQAERARRANEAKRAEEKS